MHERWRDVVLARWGHAVAAHPKRTLTICLGLAAICVVFAATNLTFLADRSELIDPTLEWNRRYLAYKQQFPRWNDVVVVLEGAADDERIDTLARDLAMGLRADGRVAAADAGFDAKDAGPGLYKIAPRPQFDDVLKDLAGARRIAAAGNANAALAVLLASLQQENDKNIRGLDRLEQFLRPYIEATGGGTADFSFLVPSQSQWQPFTSKNGAGGLRFVRVQFEVNDTGVNDLAAMLAWLRSFVANQVAGAGLEVPWGVTGIPAIESDETNQSVEDAAKASLIAATLILALMLAVYRGLSVPLLAMGALLIGLAWSFGWLVLAVGHLQVLSVMFTSILMGLGIDYALLYLSRLELVKDDHADLASATTRVFRGAGPGMITGAITAAAAFGSTVFTEFRGMSEMGLIAAGGILLCVIAVMSVMPAALALTGRWKKIVRHRPGGEHAHFGLGLLDGADRRPGLTLLLVAVAGGVMLFFAKDVVYDPDVLNLQSPSAESVMWERRITKEDARSVWAGLVLTSPEDAEAVTMRLRRLGEDVVSDVGGMGMLFPADWLERAEAITAVASVRIAPIEAGEGAVVLRSQLGWVRAGLAMRMGNLNLDGEVKTRLEAIMQSLADAQAALAAKSGAERTEITRRLHEAFGAARAMLQTWLNEALTPTPPTAADLPPVVRSQFIGGDGSWLLMVYPGNDPQGRTILNPERLGPFVERVREAAPELLGPPVQILESSRVIVRAYLLAAIYAVSVIVIVLLLDFRSLLDTLCCIAPVTLGFVGAFGAMGIADVSLNFANLIILPLIFGLGVDVSVNMVHRWRREPAGVPAGLSGGTGKGVTMAMLTTMIGFGSLMVSQHRGIWSLGFVMVFGLGLTLLACYTMLPAILRLRSKRRGV